MSIFSFFIREKENGIIGWRIVSRKVEDYASGSGSGEEAKGRRGASI